MPAPVLLLLFKLPIDCSDLVSDCCDVDNADEYVDVDTVEFIRLLPLLLPLTTGTEEVNGDDVEITGCFKDDVDAELLRPTP